MRPLMAEKKARDLFASRLGILAATLGSAVGLGNIWKFPALTGQNGGASFLLIYVFIHSCGRIAALELRRWS